MRRWIFPAALLLVLAGAAAWWSLRVDPEQVDRLSAADLSAALALDSRMPLDADHTDLVLVIACTLRHDHLEPYGYDRPTSPFLDQLAARGVLFEEQFAQAPWTRPSVGSMLTGRWPRALGLDDPGPNATYDAVLSDRHTTLAELLQARGYATYGAVANPNALSGFGFAQGFDGYMEPEGRFDNATMPESDALVDRLLADLAGVPASQRVYLQMLTTDTHQKLRPKRRYSSLFPALPQLVRLYDENIRALDREIARLYVGVKKLRPNALFVVAADHGEGLNQPEHHGRGHGNYLNRSTTQVPLIVQHPQLPEGARVGVPTMNLDLLPTLLDLLQIAPPEPVDGRSAASRIRGQKGSLHQTVYAETFFSDGHKSMAWNGRFQLIFDHETGKEELYAADDPQALHDKTRESSRANVLREDLRAWDAQMDALQQASGPMELATPDAQTNQMLEAMGYKEDAPPPTAP